MAYKSYTTYLTYPVLFFILTILFPLAPQTAQAALLSHQPNNLGLVGYWPMNEGVGVQAGDFSGNGHNGTFTNSPSWVDGKRGKALNFDSASKYVTTTGNTGISGDITVTMSAWIYPTNNSQAFQMIADQAAADVAGKCINLGLRAGKLSLDFCSGGYTQSAQLATNQWYHVVAVKTPGLMSTNTKLYVNGADVTGGGSIQGGSDSTPNVTDSNIYLSTFGASLGTNNFNGKIDDVRIYNRALSATDVSNLYTSGQIVRKNVSNNGLVGYWPMNEGVGGAIGDFSGNGKTGTLAGGVSWASGKRGSALSFNGTTGKVTLPSIQAGSSMTIAAWIKKTASTGQKSFFSSRGGGTYFGLTGTSIFLYENAATPPGITSSSGAVKIGEWQHVAVTSNSATTTFYSNGVQVYQAAQTRAGGSGGAGIGWDPELTTEFWDGLIDDVRIYNRALSAAEVSTLYNLNETNLNHNQNSRSTTGLVGLWSFNGADVSGSTAYDRSGQGRNATINGSAPLVIGKVGQAITFNNNTQYTSAAGFTDLGTSNQPYSIAGWVKINNGVTSGNVIFMSAGWCLPPVNITGGKLRATSWNGGEVDALGTTTLQSGLWYQFTTTWDATNGLTLYVNGTLEKSTAMATYSASGGSNTIYTGYSIGACAGDTGSLNGSVDEIRVYNRSLSATEVKQLYLMGK